jgi:hypothetical protein
MISQNVFIPPASVGEPSQPPSVETKPDILDVKVKIDVEKRDPDVVRVERLEAWNQVSLAPPRCLDMHKSELLLPTAGSTPDQHTPAEDQVSPT